MNLKKKLYILPFDHRGSFIKMFGFGNDLTQEQTETIADYKHVVYEGLLKSLEMGVSKDDAAVLVDEQFGSRVHQEAKKSGITRILTTEKSGQDEFDFEYGDEFADHIKKMGPDYVKVLVRYNSFGDKDINKRQTEKLKVINDFCKKEGYGFLFELLVPATSEQLESLGQEKYDNELRFQVMIDSIKELQGAGIDPEVWKIEGLSDSGQMKKVVGQAKIGNKKAGIVVLGRDENDEKVKQWLGTAAGIQGVIGFAVGRTIFKQALLDLKDGKIARAKASDIIAEKYKTFVDCFENSLN